jgi:uncharacterized protein
MELEHDFTLPLARDAAFDALIDLPRLAPCLPGATLERTEGDVHHGVVKIKVGPIKVAYAGQASFVETDRDAGTAVIECRGSEQRGAGSVQATIRARLEDDGPGTRVVVTTDLAITGKPAQFGRGVLAEVGDDLLGQFAACLGETLGGEPEAAPEPTPVGAGGEPATRERPVAAPTVRPTSDTIDLLGVAGAPLARRAAPIVAVLAAVVLLAWIIRRR